MESLSSDVVGLVLERVSDGKNRKACSEVSPEWYAIEAQTRTCVRVLDSAQIHLFLPRFPNLTTLVNYVGLSDQALMFVAECCPNLRTLYLVLAYRSEFPDEFGDIGLEAVARGCRRLVKVLLYSRNIGDAGIIALQTYSKRLAVLDLCSCHLITDMSLAAIGHMESISELHFQECSLINDNGLNMLSSGPASHSLRILTVSDCDHITDDGVLHLKRMSRLEELALTSCHKITDDGGVAVAALSNLKKLDLSGLSEITDETLFAVGEGCRNLTDISLEGCHEISGSGVVSLASSLPLEMIDISNMEECRGLCTPYILLIAERCRSLKRLSVDRELVEGLPPWEREKLSGLLNY